jgi:hypothetical protein
MNPTRTKILLGIAAVLAIALLWNWISGWGLVTVHVQAQPLAKVIRSIEKQGGIKIVTNATLETPITMDVDRVPPAEAVDILAARLDGNWSVGYVAGPTKADVAAGIASFGSNDRNRDFRTFGFGFGGGGGGGGGFGGGMEVSDTPIDSRLVVWKVSPSDTPQLQSYLEQLTIKTGLMASVPESWNPDVSKPPAGGRAADSLRKIVNSVKGVYEEVFVLRVQNEERVADAGQQQPQQRPGTDGGFGNGQRPPGGNQGGNGGGGGPRDFRPEWLQERAMARIEQLPKPEQEQAKKDFDEMRATFDKIRELPDAERRAAMDKLFSNPVVQERMSERMASRDDKNGPERRAQRSRDYIQRKQEMKAAQTAQ